MGIAYRQSNAAGSGVSPRAVAYSSAVLQGSLLVAAVAWASSSQTCTLSDTVNGSWTSLNGPQTGAGTQSASRIQMFMIQNSAAGTPTVTATTSGGANVGLAVHEYTGVSITDAVDGAGSYATSFSDPASISGFSSGNAGSCIFAMCIPDNNVVAAGSGYIQRENVNFNSNSTEDRLGVGPGTFSATFDLATAEDATLGIVSFNVADPVTPSVAWMSA